MRIVPCDFSIYIGSKSNYPHYIWQHTICNTSSSTHTPTCISPPQTPNPLASVGQHHSWLFQNGWERKLKNSKSESEKCIIQNVTHRNILSVSQCHFSGKLGTMWTWWRFVELLTTLHKSASQPFLIHKFTSQFFFVCIYNQFVLNRHKLIRLPYLLIYKPAPHFTLI